MGNKQANVNLNRIIFELKSCSVDAYFRENKGYIENQQILAKINSIKELILEDIKENIADYTKKNNLQDDEKTNIFFYLAFIYDYMLGVSLNGQNLDTRDYESRVKERINEVKGYTFWYLFNSIISEIKEIIDSPDNYSEITAKYAKINEQYLTDKYIKHIIPIVDFKAVLKQLQERAKQLKSNSEG